MIMHSLLKISCVAVAVNSFSIQSKNSVSSPKGGTRDYRPIGPRNSLATDKEHEPFLDKEYNGDDSMFPYQPALPGDCNVEGFILENITPYDGDESFLAEPTGRTLRALARLQELLEEERQRGGVWSVDVEVASTITSHSPGYLLSESDDIIKGLQTDAPLKRSCKPRGGFKVVETSLKGYGYEPSASMKTIYTRDVRTHNDYTFSMYTSEMRKARHNHLITGLPDAYGRGRLIGDYRRIALYGIDNLIQRKKADFNAIDGSSLEEMRLRGEISSQIAAMEDTIKMADKYGINLREPASNFKEAIQAMWLGLLAALKEKDGAATSAGRWDAFLDIYAERDLESGLFTESELQEIIDDLILKMRTVRHIRTPEYNSLFTGDPVWLTLALGGCFKTERDIVHLTSMVTKTSFRFLQTLNNLGPAPEPNLTVLWSQYIPHKFKRFCTKLSISTSSIQYENDDLMRPIFGSDYSISCCVSAMRCGKDMQYFGARMNLAKLLLLCLNRGRDEITGDLICPILDSACKEYGIGSGDEDEPINYIVLEHLFFNIAISWITKLYAETMNVIHYSHDVTNYENLQMALHDTNVNRLMAFGIAGLSVVVDSLAAVKFGKIFPIRNADGITEGFRGASFEELPRFGNDDDRVDEIMMQVCERFHQELDSQCLYRKSKATVSILTITSNVVYGKSTGSTPDGRLFGEPFAPGANPMHDRDRSGALASLSSVAKIPYKHCLDGISNTFCLVPSSLGKSDAQPDNLITLLEGYFSHNAHHINVNVLNRSLLEDAHLHPEKYPTLTIRVSGYAVRFNQLTPEQREEILKRTIHGSIYSVSKMKTFPKASCECTISDDFTSVDTELLNAPSHWSPNELGSVHSIETFTTTDGPGIRTLVFLQGCSKRCIYCSNPETQCIIDPHTCKNVAMEDKGVVNIVERYYDYLRPNKGGITLSGGEPLLQPNFVKSVFEKVQDMGLTTCLDTSGHGNPKIWNKVLPYTDYVMLCLKAMNSSLAFEISRVSEESAERAKDFARFVHEGYKDIKLSIRWVLLEGMTDTDDELDALIKFSKELSPSLTHIELLPFHQLGKDKYEHLNLPYPLSEMDEYPHSKALDFKKKLEKSNLVVVL